MGENDPQNELWAYIWTYLILLTFVSSFIYYIATSPGGMLLASWRHRFCHHHFTIDVQKCIKDRVLDCVQATIKNFWTQFGHQKYARDRFLWNPLVDHLPLLIARFLGYIISHVQRPILRLTKCVKTAISSKQLGCEGPLAKLVAEAHHAHRLSLEMFGVWLAGGVRDVMFVIVHTHTYMHACIHTYRHTYIQTYI